MKPLLTTLLVTLLSSSLLLAAAPAVPTVTVSGSTVTIAGERTVTVTLAESGLPAQIDIAPAPSELPLERRNGTSKPSRDELQAMGRGERLRGPVRLEAVADGKPLEVRVTQPAQVKLQDGQCVALSKLQVGPYAVELTTTLGADGALRCRLTAKGAGDADALRLAIEPAQPLDLAALPLPEGAPGAIPRETLDPTLPQGEGVVWDSAKRTADNRVPQLYVGSADAGFTLLCLDGPSLPQGTPHVTLSRDNVGRVTWSTALVSGKGGEATAYLLIHPMRVRPDTARTKAWLQWPHGLTGSTPPVAGPALFREGSWTYRHLMRRLPVLETVLAGGALERHGPPVALVLPGTPPTKLFGYLAVAQAADYAELRGPAAADMLSLEQDSVALYPMAMLRSLACGPTGLVARIRSNVRDLPRVDDRSLDRQVFGRALLHDIGVAMEGVAQPTELLTLTRALRTFGYFADDGRTEFLPYWRTEGILRYGEAFEGDSEFNLTTEDPSGGVYVSVFRRPYELDGSRGVQVMFVIVNDRKEPVRERLYVLDSERIFGKGRWRSGGATVAEGLDYGKVPDDSDWRKEKVLHFYKGNGLVDLETGGLVQEFPPKGQTAELYGPLYVPAHDYRVVWACGLPMGDDKQPAKTPNTDSHNASAEPGEAKR